MPVTNISCSAFTSLVGGISGILSVLSHQGRYPNIVAAIIIAPIAAYTAPFLVDLKLHTKYLISTYIWKEEVPFLGGTEPVCNSLITSGAKTGAIVSAAFTSMLGLGELIFIENSNCLVTITNIATNTIQGLIAGALVGYMYTFPSSPPDNDNYLVGEPFCSDDNDCYNGLF